MRPRIAPFRGLLARELKRGARALWGKCGEHAHCREVGPSGRCAFEEVAVCLSDSGDAGERGPMGEPARPDDRVLHARAAEKLLTIRLQVHRA